MNPIDFAEVHFECRVGDQRISHYLPEIDTCIPYVTYAVRSTDKVAVENAMVRTLRALEDAGGRRLYWRNEGKIE